MAARLRKRWSAWAPCRFGWRTWPHEPVVERALDRSLPAHHAARVSHAAHGGHGGLRVLRAQAAASSRVPGGSLRTKRSEEHTSELQSPCNLVCRLLLEKKKTEKCAHERLPANLTRR